MTKIGFDNDKYIKLQSQKYSTGYLILEESYTWNLAESYLTITMHQEFFRDSNLTVK